MPEKSSPQEKFPTVVFCVLVPLPIENFIVPLPDRFSSPTTVNAALKVALLEIAQSPATERALLAVIEPVSVIEQLPLTSIVSSNLVTVPEITRFA